MSDELSSLIKTSFQLIEKKEYKSALELLYPKLAEYRDNIEIIIQIAQCYLELGEKEQAEEYYEKAFEIDETNTLILDPLIELKIELEKFNEAETYLQYYLKCDDKVYSTQKYLEGLTLIKNYEEIKEFAKKEQKNDFKNFNSEAFSFVANALLELNAGNSNNDELLENALSFAQKSLELDKNNIQAICAISKYYIAKKDYERIEDLLKPLSPAQYTSELYSIYGYKKYMTGDFEKAVAYYSKALELDDENEILYLNLAESYMQMGWFKEAEVIIKKGLAVKEDSIKLRLSLANIYYMTNEFDKTILTLAFINEREPNNVEMNILYTYSYAHQNDFVKAQEYAKRLEGKIESSYIAKNLASIHYQLGQKDKAYSKIDEALDLEPNSIDILTTKAEMLQKDKEPDEALKIYDKVLEINPNYVDAYYEKALICDRTNDLKTAIEYMQKAVSMDCNNANYQEYMAELYCDMGEYDKALDCAKFSLSITPNDISKYKFIGYLYLKKDELESALSYYKEVLAINPNDFEEISGIAHILAKFNHPENAYEYYQKAFRTNPYDYEFVMEYSDFLTEHISAYQGIKLLLNYKNFTDNKNLKIESKNRAKRVIRENRNRMSLKENFKLLFK